ncbi:MAG: elongation factor P maturation arginine rhamnosyltransferase EarP [Methylophilus sp.]|uniref:elongation factor P maturation arginine rhamnosyltransferase EarP n=1 Tax=Methylophilus sp. TaxID=29541 RepID=UPI003FA07C9A
MSSPSLPVPHWDIFCRVVDNFGDIGVSWRMAHQLAHEHAIHIRLWVDDIALARRFSGSGHPLVTLMHWTEDSRFSQPAEVVIETFSCGLPDSYQQAMSADTLWLNIDYLSAEAWVQGFHGRPSPQANGRIRYFFYPGFNPQTGGLLREQFLPALALQAAQSPAAAWQQLALPAMPQAINVSLFCYAHAPVKALLTSLADSPQAVRLIVPESVAPLVAQTLGEKTLEAGQSLQHQQCTIVVIPFLSQSDYDLLLSLCDLNFVRGEDSWIRAIWAAKPMVWLPYQQSENTHLEKLAAFVQHYLASANDEVNAALQPLMQAWATGEWSAEHWHTFITHRDSISQHARHYADQLSEQPDLTTNLVIFIEKLRANRV